MELFKYLYSNDTEFISLWRYLHIYRNTVGQRKDQFRVWSKGKSKDNQEFY